MAGKTASKPIKKEEKTISGQQLVDTLAKAHPGPVYAFAVIARLAPMVAILESPPDIQVQALRHAAKLVAGIRLAIGNPRDFNDVLYMNLHHTEEFSGAAWALMARLLMRNLPLTQDDLTDVIQQIASVGMISSWSFPFLSSLIGVAEKMSKKEKLSETLRNALKSLSNALNWIDNAPERKLRLRIGILADGGNSSKLSLIAGEAWSDRALADLQAMPQNQREAWMDLLLHCAGSKSTAPSRDWLDNAAALIKAVGETAFKTYLTIWLPLVAQPRTQRIEDFSAWIPDPNVMIIDPHMDILKGLAWCCSLSEDPDIARALTALATTSYRKVPKIGPRAVRVGNACVWALGAIPTLHAVGQLAMLRTGVKFGTAQKAIEKATIAAAKRLNMSRDDIEELGVPTYGLDRDGHRNIALGEARAELQITLGGIHIAWFNTQGKAVKVPPTEIKKQYAPVIKEIKNTASDIDKMLSAQKQRIDNLLILTRTWTYEDFTQRYLEHPVIAPVARGLIWLLDDTPVIWRAGKPEAIDGNIISATSTTQVTLWHPVLRPMPEVLAWRQRLIDLGITQPFKQAHREIYLLTDAERRTHVYSNRFAAHVIRQHQFNALCAARGWKNKLRLMVDDSYPAPSKELTHVGLRAEFWIEPIGSDYGTDTNESGVFHRLATDQIRFYKIGSAQARIDAIGGGYNTTAAEPIPLEQIPPLILSEIMRDVDLFVGVASIGNDPTWSDGGPDGRFRTYWETYSFGDLSATAQTRRDVLQALLPRLKIAERCEMTEKFLVVRGTLRTYKIHLGSGNILMEPNDQYLCIVPKSSGEQSGVFLPFEGDRTLAIILSKAMMLAADTQIKDETITRQINGK